MNEEILKEFETYNGFHKLALLETKALVSLLSKTQQDLWVSRVKQFCTESGIDPATGAPLQPET